MKKILFILFLLPFFGKSQDVITMKDGSELSVKVIEIGIDDIKYRKEDNGPTYVMRKSDIFMIKYANGSKDVFKDVKQIDISIAKAQESDSIQNMFLQGQKDADKYYKGMNSGAGGTFLTTITLGGLLGVIPAAICSSHEPRRENLMLPNKNMYSNENYMDGYVSQAHKIKRRKVWTLFGIGCGINLIVFYNILHHG